MEIFILYNRGIKSYQELLQFCEKKKEVINEVVGDKKRKLILESALD